MSKRCGKVFESSFSSPAKKPKLDVTVTPSQQDSKPKKQPTTSKSCSQNDVWEGVDFAEEDFEEMDLVASQASIHATEELAPTHSSKTSPRPLRNPSDHSNSKPSTSYHNPNTHSKKSTFQPKTHSGLSVGRQNSTQASHCTTKKTSPIEVLPNNHCRIPTSQKLASSEKMGKNFEHDKSVLFEDFKAILLTANNHNSTFRPHPQNNSIVSSDDNLLQQLEKLKVDYKRLEENFMTKEGEAHFLRTQLQQVNLKAEQDKKESARKIEELANQHRSEINAILKEKDKLETDLKFDALRQTTDKCKLVESRSIRHTEPHTATLNSPNRSRFNTTLTRSSTVKSVKLTEVSVQTSFVNNSFVKLKTLVNVNSLNRIRPSIFESSLPEKSVVDIKIVEKSGERNLPILQDEDTFRIFENPDLVKPVVTTVDNQKLNVEFILPEVAMLMKKTNEEINSSQSIPLINKLVSTARELMLNSSAVLRTISEVMKNDDIRDMNDIYFSGFYKMPVDHCKSICDPSGWYEEERGIEARRSIAVLSYIVRAARYLSEYVAGKTVLNVKVDPSYGSYNEQMRTYQSWSKKGCKFELLEIILEFVSVVRLVRRIHQFSGLIIAIIKLLCNTLERVEFCNEGLKYVFNIFREIVFARPLLSCFAPLTKMLKTYGKFDPFFEKLCVISNRTVITLWKNAPHFTPDACVVQIYMTQLDYFHLDPTTMINVTYSLVPFVHSALSSTQMSWMTTISDANSCNCCISLLGVTLGFLYKTLTVNPEELNVNIRCRQVETVRTGIRFLSSLAKQEHHFNIKLLDFEDFIYLFLHRIDSLAGLKLDNNEREALDILKVTFLLEKTLSLEGVQPSRSSVPMTDNYKMMDVPAQSKGQMYSDKKLTPSFQRITSILDDDNLLSNASK